MKCDKEIAYSIIRYLKLLKQSNLFINLSYMINSMKINCRYLLLILTNILLLHCLSFAQQVSQANVLLNSPNYPVVFGLNTGESYTLVRKLDHNTIKQTIKLISVTPSFEPNFWFNKGLLTKTYASAKVVVEVGGKRITLLHRPYQTPVTIKGLRLYVEAIKEWSENADYAKLKNVKKLVRLSACADRQT